MSFRELNTRGAGEPTPAPSAGAAGPANWADTIGREVSDYPMRRVLQTRVSDLDGYGHLNAIRLGHFYEDARAAFHVAVGREGARVLVAQLTLRYLAEGRWPGEAEVGTGIVRIGRSSIVMGQGLFQGGRRIGICETVLVNTLDGHSSPLSAAYREALWSHRLGERQSGEDAAPPPIR